MTLEELNAADAAAFTAALGDVFENAPWVAERAAAARPFASVAALHDALMAAVRGAGDDRITAFLRGHPLLASAGAMGGLSASEQAGLALRQADADLPALNAAYSARFGIPFILCIRRHSRASLLAVFRDRLTADAAAEREAALHEVGYITRLRLVDRLPGPGAPIVHGSLTTHVLDTAVGRPAEGVPVTLFEAGASAPLAERVTDAQGRTPPLLEGAPLRIGAYELQFQVGRYFGVQPAFLDVIPVRFAVSSPETHYHIPLLVSPGAYSTYRGS